MLATLHEIDVAQRLESSAGVTIRIKRIIGEILLLLQREAIVLIPWLAVAFFKDICTFQLTPWCLYFTDSVGTSV